MFKREWTVFSILAACTVAVTCFSFIYTRSDGTKVEWLTYVAAVAILATLAFLALLLYLHAKQKFNILLAREHFVAQKQYDWAHEKLLIDFDSKRIANTYLSTKPIVAFADIASFRLESYRIGEQEELPENQRFLSLVITVKKDGFEDEYLYIPAFEVKVESADITDGMKEVGAELVEKYPELKALVELQSDLKQIVAINEASGIHYNIQNN